jgi:glycosyltransferase involved in cell wall biosynthesis
VLVLSRNFGHQAAYTAGLNYAKGDYVAMMDGDLQDPPELIAQMYRKLTTKTWTWYTAGERTGGDLREKAHDQAFSPRLPAILADE